MYNLNHIKYKTRMTYFNATKSKLDILTNIKLTNQINWKMFAMDKSPGDEEHMAEYNYKEETQHSLALNEMSVD